MKKNLFASVVLLVAITALVGCASMAAKDKAIATLPATGYSQDFNPSLMGFLFGGAYHEKVCFGQSCSAQRVVVAPQALTIPTNQTSGAVPCGLYSAPDAPSSGSVGNVSRNTATCPQGTATTSSGWLDPQGPEYRVWSCRKYGSFNDAPCR